MTHRGEIVAKAVRMSGIKITDLAKRLKKSRKWVYDSFENKSLSYDVILSIGKVIHHDFSKEFPQLSEAKSSKKSQLVAEARTKYSLDDNSAEYWKNKYLHLLEEYNLLLIKKSK